ncbi:MAG: AAA family ATPase, partial [Lachnospiraceae bacterium]|nr:AAA family ATPase [Lachnospiraceae bacterium]
KRYNRETLEIRYRGKSIYDVLDMTVEEALRFFDKVPRIRNKIRTLYDVGLGYIRLGQPSTQLSGGEAQRIKLAAELSKRATGRTIYILDEPTTGLHFEDVRKLIEILMRLRDQGNTVVVIEHNLDVIKSADYLIDLGPEGGDRGGTLVACGTPEEVAGNKDSWTGRYVKKYLKAR